VKPLSGQDAQRPTEVPLPKLPIPYASLAPAAIRAPLVGMLVGALAGLSSVAGKAFSAVAGPPQGAPVAITATPIARTPGSARPGTIVRQRQLSRRVFADARHGFALASLPQAQYPAATTDGGKVWRVDGPALHVNAAQAPLVVLQVGAAGRRTWFAWGGPGGGQVVDTTSDGGRHWWRAILGEVVLAVVASADGRLIAVTQVAGAAGASTLVYVSKDGGRHWRYDAQLGAG
jgi:hypothetical protein